MALDRQTIDPAALDALIGKAVTELAAGYGGVMIDIGHKLGSTRRWRRPARSRARK